jgi:hypothetical protein
MSDTDIKGMAASLRDVANEVTTYWSAATGEEPPVHIPYYVALDMIDHLRRIANALEAMTEAERREP